MNLRTLRIALWVWVAIAAAAALGAYAWQKSGLGGEVVASSFGQGDYSLETGAGKPFTPASFTGAPTMLFFGYTHCPDVCPTTMAQMALWFHELGADGKALRAVFVSVDPERDTPAVLNDYVHAVSDRITGVTGTEAEIGKIEKAWGVYAKKVPLTGSDYSMDHTATVYLLDSKGQFQGTIAYQEDDATAVQKLRNLVAKS
jgi:protein SCO1/2